MNERLSQVEAAVHNGMHYLESIQDKRGFVRGEVVWSPILTAQYIVTSAICGVAISEERKLRFFKHFDAWQREGGWGMHAESPPYLYVTTLVYVAMRLMGREADHPSMVAARHLIQEQGGVLNIPTWGKAWLALFNLYKWEGVAPIVPELWLQPKWSPVHPRRMYCHTRLIYLGLSYLYGVAFQHPVDEMVLALRQELYPAGFEKADFKAARYKIAEGDLFEAPALALKGAYEALGVVQRFLPSKIRKMALHETMRRIVRHQEESRFSAISPVNGLLNTIALFHADHPHWRPSLEGVDYWAWQDEEEGERFNGAHSHTWDTAFVVQGLCEGPFAKEHKDFLERTARFFKRAQMRQEFPERERYYRDKRLGGFCFSDEHHQWPVSDTTAEALSAMSYLYEWVDHELLPEPHMLVEAVRFVLTRQNEDGGFGSYERQRGGAILKKNQSF